MMPPLGWLVVLRRWLGVEIEHRPTGAPHAALTSVEERDRIDERIRQTRKELDMLLADAALDQLRSRRRWPDASR